MSRRVFFGLRDGSHLQKVVYVDANEMDPCSLLSLAGRASEAKAAEEGAESSDFT